MEETLGGRGGGERAGRGDREQPEGERDGQTDRPQVLFSDNRLQVDLTSILSHHFSLQ